MSEATQSETVTLELFAQINDPDHQRLSVILSDGQITLQPSEGARFWFSRQTFDHIADLVRRHDVATHAVSSGDSPE